MSQLSIWEILEITLLSRGRRGVERDKTANEAGGWGGGGWGGQKQKIEEWGRE